ncbi:alpha/beta fold hydrolase [Sporobolomyces salmoneus]|uniref:alpha/beta fold hydrolase n=1 Tax=Sporobolomyces salmoneus TaxID=183962 RepID=UPI00317BA416
MVRIPDFETAQVSPDLQLAYLDSFSLLEPSERPEKYTTILAIHGVGFNSAIFSPLIPHLPPKTRLIAYNQRSYRGSSPAFESKEKGGVDATARYLEDFLGFLEWSTKELGLTSKRDGGQVIVLSWSKGTVIPISLLALLNSTSQAPSPSTSFLPHLAPSTLSLARSLVSSHISSLILFEPPGSAFSRPPTQDFLTSMSSVLPPNDQNVTRQEWALTFAGWVADYRAPRDEVEESQELEKSRLEDFEPELVERGWEWEGVKHGFEWTLAGEKEEIRKVGEMAIRGRNHEEVGVGLVYGSRTVGYFEETVEMVREWWKEDEVGNKVIRSVEGTNHFGFVHKPKEFVDVLMGCVRDLK